MTERARRGPFVVALGGGHGLHASLTALRAVAGDIAAIVTVADDGGSSGRLRGEMGIVPPGDLRMALSALCDEGDWGTMWRDVLQTRFSTPGPLDGHALGNLLIAGLWERTGDVVEGLEWVGRLLRARGRVLPLAAEPLEISAMVESEGGWQLAKGQVAVATARGTLTGLAIDPPLPVVPRQTIDALREADAVVLGPGSWFTSVLVHFLVAPVADALVEAGHKTVLSLNIAPHGEGREGGDRVEDIQALRRLEPRFVPAAVLVEASLADKALAAEVDDWGTRLVVAPMRESGTVDRHDVDALAVAYATFLTSLSDRADRHGMAG